MATEIVDAPLGEIRAESAAGTALTTTAVGIGYDLGSRWLSITPRNFSSANVARIQLVPWLSIVKTQDNHATFTDYSENAQDGASANVVDLSSQNTLANGDALYLGAAGTFRGVYVNTTTTNSTGSRTLRADAWTGSLGWFNLTSSISDGTSGSTALDQDGNVTWTIPAAWVTATLDGILSSLSNAYVLPDALRREFTTPLFWIRWTYNGALDSTTTCEEMIALHRSAAYGSLVEGQPLSTKANHSFGGIGGIEALTDTGTANLLVNGATLGGEFV